ncbi:MAG TPA: TrpB-like pyridoxal phosphate-dependent enzyme [Actinomycetota bacterium]|nr:TrpB-like pyridoxal phosphate-dependent enzyme [Actinomycetota bacterium]
MPRDDVRKIVLEDSQIPTAWYNILPDLPGDPMPPLHPGTMQPAGPEDLAPLFPEALIQQEMSPERWIDIPGPVIDIYKTWRPSPLYRARKLEESLGLNGKQRIYYKWEGVSPAGSHKPNTAVPQAYYNKEAGTRKLTTETGAGQWGSALSMSCAMFGLECEVFMVRASFDQKPYRRILMETWGGTVHPSPSQETEAGRQILKDDPNSTGSLGIAISEAVEIAAQNDDTKYSLGSVLNHVCTHQTVVGLEAKLQMEGFEDTPDIVIGCVGGGSNFAGLSYPFVKDVLAGDSKMRFLAVEPEACPTLTRGIYAYDFGDTAGTTPLMPMYTLGHDFVPAPVHAGGLRYHGDAPSLCGLVKAGLYDARAYPQVPVFQAAVQFAKAEGFLPGPEPAHALKGAIDEALAAQAADEERVILFNLCGHGHFDMTAYDAYLSGRLEDFSLPQETLDESLSKLPPQPAPA